MIFKLNTFDISRLQTSTRQCWEVDGVLRKGKSGMAFSVFKGKKNRFTWIWTRIYIKNKCRFSWFPYRNVFQKYIRFYDKYLSIQATSHYKKYMLIFVFFMFLCVGVKKSFYRIFWYSYLADSNAVSKTSLWHNFSLLWTLPVNYLFHGFGAHPSTLIH